MPDKTESKALPPDGSATLEPGNWMPVVYRVAVGIFIAVVPLVITAGFWIWMSISESRQVIKNYFSTRATQITKDIDAWILEEFEVLEAIGEVFKYQTGDGQIIRKLLVDMDTKISRWRGISLYNGKTGEFMFNTRGRDNQPSSPKAVTAIRRAVSDQKPVICSCFIDENPNSPAYGLHLFVPVLRVDGTQLVLSVVLEYGTIQRMAVTAAASFYDVDVADENDKIIALSSNVNGLIGLSSRDEIGFDYSVTGQMSGFFEGKTKAGDLRTGAYSRSALTGWTVITEAGPDNVDTLALQSKWAFLAVTGLCLVLIAVLCIIVLYSMMLRRVGAERMAVSEAVNQLQTRLLQTTNAALEEQSKAASEREVLLREIYHRVKNNLQIVQSLLRLGARDLCPVQKEPFDAAVRRIGAMARVHTLLYNSPDLASIDLKDYLASIVAEVSEGFGAETRDIHTHLDVQSMKVPLDSAIPIAFISIELLANAFKHAFPDGRSGKINVFARNEGDTGILIISDNGVGMPDRTGRKKPLGLNLVGKLIEQVGGKLEAPEIGHSEYRITFPLTGRPQTGTDSETSST